MFNKFFKCNYETSPTRFCMLFDPVHINFSCIDITVNTSSRKKYPYRCFNKQNSIRQIQKLEQNSYSNGKEFELLKFQILLSKDSSCNLR